MEWSGTFCLACDRQTCGEVYCSITCRLKDYEKSVDTSVPSSNSSVPALTVSSPAPILAEVKDSTLRFELSPSCRLERPPSRSGRVRGSSESDLPIHPRPRLVQLPPPYDFRQHRIHRSPAKPGSASADDDDTLREVPAPSRCTSLSPRHCLCAVRTPPSPGRLELDKELGVTEEALRSLQEYHRLLAAPLRRASTCDKH